YSCFEWFGSHKLQITPFIYALLQDYLLVSSTSIEMDLYRKNEAGDWLIINYQAGDNVELKSINLSFPIEQIYRNLDLTPETESTKLS
ncbi:hypothetical protein MEO40_27505, partial [Dolichospermum sp. ST_sed1]|nr:hypothetical protein [Dolichospermum sp. ST_sed1]